MVRDIRVTKTPQARGYTALLSLPTAHTLRRNAHFHTHTDYFATWVNTVYFLICLILWCTCSVLLWCGVGGGVFFGLLGGTEEAQIQRDCHLSLSLFYLLVFLRGDVLSVTSLPSGSWLKNWKNFVGTDHKHIPDYSLSVLSFESRFFLVATIQHVSSSCWLTCI